MAYTRTRWEEHTVKFGTLDRYRTGTAVPVSALRSRESCGIGEFADLVPFADVCRRMGIDMIQILPVNDTGVHSSPYSALSAFALHPNYLRIDDLPDWERVPDDEGTVLRAEVERLRHEHEARKAVHYPTIRAAKATLSYRIYTVAEKAKPAGAELDRWIGENPWVRPYAVFKMLKEQNGGRAWHEWQEYRDPVEADIEAFWASEETQAEIRYYAWLQMRLEEQLRSASEGVAKLGIALKGDIPILMDEDSADVWFHRRNFDLNLRAGAPPDVYSYLGQNWGFPIYDWEYLARDDYAWWRRRLHQAAKFFHAYRIDHVLGFFRIWSTPRIHSSAILGYFHPQVPISRAELLEAGFDAGRIRWLSEPHVTGDQVRFLFGDRAASILEHFFDRLPGEDLYTFMPSVAGERYIAASGLSDADAETLSSIYRDRTLLEIGPDEFTTTWSFRECSRYETLNDAETTRFEAVVEEASARSEALWDERGRSLLDFMRSTTEMLTCAEDLGAVPKVVPIALADLGILGLRVPRWVRMDAWPGQPFVNPREYPSLTVCALSVHDTTTARQWWEEEKDRDGFWKTLGYGPEAPKHYDVATARKLIAGVLRTSSLICVLQLQDWFALDKDLREADAKAERINVPGTVNDTNWSYRMPLSIEDLAERGAFLTSVQELVVERSRRPLTDGETENGEK